ncbi:peptidyl-prolyl cis-trans isomerase C [Inquilinus ginsengisoli]|uniref:Parvulin-like PPIase n=1 Tax=Inquilinus ginsengisoli TaxID=363840 RepID=A0ABU1K0M4_9PROT|nr:peptidylprolyl isomerase [Inquilinus ginsengisoli]MDR6294072.1 peptidyl-prolyl cis-trans isomerase C [Inquilinus ginsengisoli]
MSSLALRLLAGAAALSLLAAGPAMAQDAAKPAETPAAAAPATAAPADADPVAATVNGQPILRSEVLEAINGLPQQYRQMPVEMLVPLMAEQVATARLVADKGIADGLQNDPEVKGRLETAERRIIQDVWLQRQIKARITDQVIQDAYKKYLADNPPQEQVKARHILVDSEDKAKDLIKKLEGGAKFEELANTNTTDPSGKESGGDLGWFAKDQMVPEFADAAFKLEKGKYTTTPVKSQFGWHVILVEDKRTLPQPTLDEVKPQLEEQLSQSLVPQIIAEVKKGATIVVMGQDGKPLPPPSTDAPAPGAAPGTDPAAPPAAGDQPPAAPAK